MSQVAAAVQSREIIIDEVFPHTADLVWQTLTTPELIGRWLMGPTRAISKPPFAICSDGSEL